MSVRSDSSFPFRFFKLKLRLLLNRFSGAGQKSYKALEWAFYLDFTMSRLLDIFGHDQL